MPIHSSPRACAAEGSRSAHSLIHSARIAPALDQRPGSLVSGRHHAPPADRTSPHRAAVPPAYSHPHRPPGLHTPSGGARWTHDDVARWCAALPAPLYDLRLIPADGGRTEMRRVDAEALLRLVPWLRARNRAGHHVYARPLSTQHILIDDLTPTTLARLREQHAPCVVVETSPALFQAWLTVASEPIDERLAAAAARLLALRYEGDPGAASAVQVGRLPGLRNRKRSRGWRTPAEEILFPLARLRWAAGPAIDPAGPALLRAAVTEMAPSAPSDRTNSAAKHTAHHMSPSAAAAEWARGAARVSACLGSGVGFDRSRVDYAIARRLLTRSWRWEAVAAVLSAGPRARELPPSIAARYVVRTLVAASRAAGGAVSR
jgi:hypothetical protein